ncbi:MAG: AsmA family protein [Rhodanobacteraceae bacterium]|nr:AsmA family protein [Rhodanobacteraceae bacterium]
MLLTLAFAALLVLRQYAQPERVAALLVEQTRTRLGLALVFEAPARYSLWPRLHLQLNHLRLTLPEENEPLLALERLDISLPWSSLLDSALVVEELRLTRPQLELRALQRWQARADSATAAPDLRLHLHIDKATLLHDHKPVARDLDFDGEINTQQLQRWWDQLVLANTAASALPPLPGTARIGTIELDGVRLDGVRVESVPAQ